MVKLCSYAARNSRFWTSSAVVERKSTCTKSSLLPSLFWPAKTCTSYPRVGQGGSGLPIQFVPTTVGGFCLHNMTRERLFLCQSHIHVWLFVYKCRFPFFIFIWPMGREHFNLATCMCTQGRNSASSYTYVFHDGVLQTAGGQTYVVCV